MHSIYFQRVSLYLFCRIEHSPCCLRHTYDCKTITEMCLCVRCRLTFAMPICKFISDISYHLAKKLTFYRVMVFTKITINFNHPVWKCCCQFQQGYRGRMIIIFLQRIFLILKYIINWILLDRKQQDSNQDQIPICIWLQFTAMQSIDAIKRQ